MTGTDPTGSRSPKTYGPLHGIVVADFSRVLAGPLASMMMGDLGADVIKVERPGVGDDTREWGPPFVGDESTYFLSVNRNKKSVELDLRSARGQATALALIDHADVLIENFSVGTMDRLGLDWETAHARNPQLIYCSISGFGRQSGATMPGYDFLVQAMGGLMSITGDEGGPPLKAGVALVDVIAGLHATIGVLAAIQAREQTGIGQRVDISLMSSLLASLVNQASSFVAAGVVPKRMGNRHPSIAPYETFEAADGMLVLTVGNDSQFRRLCEKLDLTQIAVDARFSTNAARVANRGDLIVLLGDVIRTQPVSHWVTLFADTTVPCGPVNDLSEAFALASDLGLAPVEVLNRLDGTAVQTVASPLTLSDTPVSYRTAPPTLGHDTVEILNWLASTTGGSAGPTGSLAQAPEPSQLSDEDRSDT